VTAGRWAIGIDLGGTKTEAVALDAAGQERWRQRIATPSAQGYAAIVDALCALVDQAGRPAAAGRASASARRAA
jgi:fructokinase